MLRGAPPERSGEETGRAWRERRKKLPKGCRRNLHSWEEARKTGNSGKDFMATWGYSSAGRAPALQAGGQRFDPVYLHQQPDAAAARCCATPRRRDPGRKRAEHGGRVVRRFRKTKQHRAEKWLQEAEYAAERPGNREAEACRNGLWPRLLWLKNTGSLEAGKHGLIAQPVRAHA